MSDKYGFADPAVRSQFAREHAARAKEQATKDEVLEVRLRALNRRMHALVKELARAKPGGPVQQWWVDEACDVVAKAEGK